MSRSSSINLFYGYPVELLMQWCCVGRSTAINLKNGQKPSKRILKLFELHRDGRVLGDEWDGWAVRKGMLCDPEGHETTQAQLRAYPFVWQLAHEYTRQNEAARTELSRLIAWQLKAAAPANPPQRQQRRMAKPTAAPGEPPTPTPNREVSRNRGTKGPGSPHELPRQQTLRVPAAKRPAPRREAPSIGTRRPIDRTECA
jgi:hypothetical protein